MKKILRLLKRSSLKPQKSHSPVVPSGLIACTESGYFYIKGKKRFKLISERAVHSWGLPIVLTKESIMSNFPIMGSLGFRDGTLIKDVSDGKIYLISDSKRRHVVNPDVLDWINIDPMNVGQKEVGIHEEGEAIG